MLVRCDPRLSRRYREFPWLLKSHFRVLSLFVSSDPLNAITEL